MNKGDLQDNFKQFYEEYRDFISKMDPDNLDIEKIDDMYNQAKVFSEDFNKTGRSVDENTKERISLMLEKLEGWKNEAEARGIHIFEAGASTASEAGTSTVPVEVASTAPEAGKSTASVEVASTASVAETPSAPAPMESGGQPILKKVENPGLKYVNAAIEYAETGLKDDAGQPRKGDFGDLDDRMQFLKDFVRGDANYTVENKSLVDLKEDKIKDKEEEVKQIVKNFLGMGENEPENSEKSRQYRFIINAGQDLISMFTDDVKHNIQYQGADIGPVGTPPMEMKWSKQGEELILELECNNRVLGLGREMPEKLMARNPNGEVELFELGEEPEKSPPLVRYNYKAKLVPTENGAKLETISYSVELHPGLSHKSQEFTFSAPNVFTEMQNKINAFNNRFTGTEEGRTLADQIERLKNAIVDVKSSPHYNFVKESNGGTREEKIAVSMIVRLDKILQASENSKIPIPASIMQKAILFQVNRMKNSTEFTTGMVSLTKKSKPSESLESKEESMDTKKVEKEDLRMMKEFIERVDRLQKGIIGTVAVVLDNKEVYKNFKGDFNTLKKTQKEVGGDVTIDRAHWNGMLQNLHTVSDELANVHVYGQGFLHSLSNDGARFSVSETGKNNLRKKIDLIKITPEYLEYQQQKREGKEKENPLHAAFTALDKCEKLLVKAISTQKLPLVSRANDNKLKKFFEENATKFQPPSSPTSRVSVSNK